MLPWQEPPVPPELINTTHPWKPRETAGAEAEDGASEVAHRGAGMGFDTVLNCALKACARGRLPRP